MNSNGTDDFGDVAQEAAEFLQNDPELEPLVHKHGPLKLEPAENLYQRLVISILRQQVSMASAEATRERLFDHVKVTPEGILGTDPETLRDCGLSRQKTRYVREVAQAFEEEEYDIDYFAGNSNEQIVQELTNITGIGPWTARMQLLFTFARPDVFPVGDLGVRKGMAELFDVSRENKEWMVDRATEWKPYRSYASLYLWRVNEDTGDQTK